MARRSPWPNEAASTSRSDPGPVAEDRHLLAQHLLGHDLERRAGTGEPLGGGEEVGQRRVAVRRGGGVGHESSGRRDGAPPRPPVVGRPSRQGAGRPARMVGRSSGQCPRGPAGRGVAAEPAARHSVARKRSASSVRPIAGDDGVRVRRGEHHHDHLRTSRSRWAQQLPPAAWFSASRPSRPARRRASADGDAHRHRRVPGPRRWRPCGTSTTTSTTTSRLRATSTSTPAAVGDVTVDSAVVSIGRYRARSDRLRPEPRAGRRDATAVALRATSPASHAHGRLDRRIAPGQRHRDARPHPRRHLRGTGRPTTPPPRPRRARPSRPRPSRCHRRSPADERRPVGIGRLTSVGCSARRGVEQSGSSSGS